MILFINNNFHIIILIFQKKAKIPTEGRIHTIFGNSILSNNNDIINVDNNLSMIVLVLNPRGFNSMAKPNRIPRNVITISKI